MVNDPDSIDVNELFKIVAENGGSDLHLRYDLMPKMRKNGVLVPLPGYEDFYFTPKTVENLIFRTMEPIYDDEAERSKENNDENTYGKFVHNRYGLNYAYEAFYHGKPYGRWRISVYISRKNEGMVARLLQDEPLTFEDLKAHETIPKILNNQDGIIFVTGATGSGKSTLMGAMVDKINSTMPVNIISLEDPIEMIHTPKVASVIQRDVGLGIDEESYESALQNALRQDPDVILIGEIRSIETMRAAFEAANTGHLVITTLHTSSAAETINRVLKLYPYDEREGVAFDLAAALRGIISQKLLPAKHGTGRIAVNEILVNTSKVRRVISEEAGNADKLYDLIASGEAGSITFEQFMLEKVESDELDFEAAYRASSRKEFFDDPGVPGEPAVASVKPETNLPEVTPQVEVKTVSEEVIAPRTLLPTVRANITPVTQKLKEETPAEEEGPEDSSSEDFSDIGEPTSRYNFTGEGSESSGGLSGLKEQFSDFYTKRTDHVGNAKPGSEQNALDLNLTRQGPLTTSFPKREPNRKQDEKG